MRFNYQNKTVCKHNLVDTIMGDFTDRYLDKRIVLLKPQTELYTTLCQSESRFSEELSEYEMHFIFVPIPGNNEKAVDIVTHL